MKDYKIDDLLGLTDQELSVAFGFQAKIERARKNLEDLAALSGKARAEAESRVAKLLNPEVYVGELDWIKEDVTRSARIKSGNVKPADLLDD